MASRVLITGMSGTGKSTILAGLADRGHLTVDTDYDGWIGEDGRWDEPRMARLLGTEDRIVVAGTVENQGAFYDRFDHVVLLTAPLSVLLDRVARRTNNPYGKRPEEAAEIAEYVETVEPLLRRGATVILDATRPPIDLVDAVDRLISSGVSL